MALTFEEFLGRIEVEGLGWALAAAEQAKKHLEYTRRSHRNRTEERRRAAAEYDRRWREAHTNYMREYMREWLRAHPGYRRQERTEYMRRYGHLYRRLHPERIKAQHAARRARLLGAGGKFTPEEFRLLCEAYGSRCIYCRQVLPLTPDHIVPLFRGGSNAIDNIVPACKSCNSKKHTMTYDEFVERLQDDQAKILSC